MKPAFASIRVISGNESRGMHPQNAYGFVFARNKGVIRHIGALMI